ncbi:MAG: hypothetical protein K8R53_01370, partial [Bacteroidales bacterium]|nr:hypothetical protein [Bacteroidales bacterium]
MKKFNQILLIGLTILLYLGLTELKADVYNSTAAGGDWSAPATWEEGVVPAGSDDVVITGPGTVYINVNNLWCQNLTVNSGATFQNPNWVNILFGVGGDIVNNGTITKSNYNLNINFYGNITNNGTWTFSTANLNGSTTQYITLGTGQEFACSGFTCNYSSSVIVALTDLTFNGTQIDFYGSQLILPATKGGSLTLHGGYLYRIDLVTNSGTLIMDGGATILANSIIHNATLDSTIIINGDPVYFEGETVNNGT